MKVNGFKFGDEQFVVTTMMYDKKMNIEINDNEYGVSTVTFKYTRSTYNKINNVIGLEVFVSDLFATLLNVYNFFKDAVNTETGTSMLDDWGFEHVASTALDSLYEDYEYAEGLEIWI